MKVKSEPRSTRGRCPLAVAVAALVGAAVCAAALASAGSPGRPEGLLAFHADPGGDSGLYVMGADGSGVHLASPNLAGHPFSRWSPEGAQLLFLSGAYGEGALRLLDLGAKRERTIGSDTVRAYDWSPDGRSLVYESHDGTMWLAPAGGAGKPRRLGRGHGPDWSPDGRWIAYFDASGDPDVFKLPVRGGKPVRLTSHRGADFSPQWSPNGRTIAFVSERDGNTELYLVSADGLKTRRLTRDPAHRTRRSSGRRTAAGSPMSPIATAPSRPRSGSGMRRSGRSTSQRAGLYS